MLSSPPRPPLPPPPGQLAAGPRPPPPCEVLGCRMLIPRLKPVMPSFRPAPVRQRERSARGRRLVLWLLSGRGVAPSPPSHVTYPCDIMMRAVAAELNSPQL